MREWGIRGETSFTFRVGGWFEWVDSWRNGTKANPLPLALALGLAILLAVFQIETKMSTYKYDFYKIIFVYK